MLFFEGYAPLALRWRCGSGMTLPHSTQLTLPAFRSSTGTQSEIMRLCIQAHGRLTRSGCWACVDSLKFTMHLRVTVGSRFRLVWWGYSRIVVEALSTRTGLSCRIDTTSNVVVCTTGGKGSAACFVQKSKKAVIRNQKRKGCTCLSLHNSELRTFTPRVPAESRTGPAPHSFSYASFRESLHGRC